MSDTKGSKLQLVGIGTAAANLELDSDVLQVTDLERSMFMDGEIISLPFEAEAAGQDSQGNSFNVKVTTDQAIPARWYRSNNTNRLTPPNIRRGMRVLIWQYADKNEYWWTNSGLDDDKFRLETVVFQISATQDESANGQDPANSYYLEMSSHKKMITLATSNANGEFTRYCLQLNLAEGRVVLADDLGNDFTLDSKETIVSMENAETTFLALAKKDLVMRAPQNIQILAEKNLDIVCEKFDLQCMTGSITASSKFTLKTPVFDAQVDASTFTGTITAVGGITGKGGGSFESAVTFRAVTTFEQQINASGINSSLPIRGPTGTI